jgi:hypothetical protein
MLVRALTVEQVSSQHLMRWQIAGVRQHLTERSPRSTEPHRGVVLRRPPNVGRPAAELSARVAALWSVDRNRHGRGGGDPQQTGRG